MPAGLTWFIGKSIVYFSKTQIDHEGLFLAPPEIKIAENAESDQSIDMMVLSNKFNQLDIPNDRVPDQTSKQNCLFRLCNWTEIGHNDIYSAKSNKIKLFCQELTSYLRGFIKK